MRWFIAGQGLSAAALLFVSSLVFAGELVATRADGIEIARLPAPPGAGWCILWNHSVRGFPVTDCYQNRDGQMMLVSSHQPDFAAGLGHIPGRGRVVSHPQGGYWVLDIDEPVPGNAYVLRPGAGSVDHRIQSGDTVISLSAAAAGQRVRIELTD